MASERQRKLKSSVTVTESHGDKLPLDLEYLRATLISKLSSTIAEQRPHCSTVALGVTLSVLQSPCHRHPRASRRERYGYLCHTFSRMCFVFGSGIFPTPPLLDRAHRIGPVPSADRENQRPRVMIVRFHYCNDKEKAVRHGNWNQLFHQSRKVFIFPDFNSSVAKRRASLIAVRNGLREKSARFSLSFPARLLIDLGDEKLQFDCPKEAQRWFNKRYSTS
ncbi:unnamed protein product [Leuciscus chuanchicus]